jgi:hypothetical protein
MIPAFIVFPGSIVYKSLDVKWLSNRPTSVCSRYNGVGAQGFRYRYGYMTYRYKID